MKDHLLLLSVAPMALIVSPASAQDAPAAAPKVAADNAAKKAPTEEVFTTGVAKGRDRLDSATSTSALRADDIQELGARSLAEILRNIPGIRAESVGGEGNGSYSIRGLPLASSGSKYIQLQEDGLPALEFGDITNLSPDIFMRADLNLAAIEAIRGGSASTFASNSPGGVINLISKTGDVEGGAVMASTGINYGEHRLDADFGHKLSDTLRFHVGGFYHRGEGPRHVGYDAVRGGQVKFNITKQFSNGFIRVNAKYLDDHEPAYGRVALRVAGTNSDPEYSNVAGINVKRDSLLSRYIRDVVILDEHNNLASDNLRTGMHPIVKAIGLESQMDFGPWTVSEKFRYADVSGSMVSTDPALIGAAAVYAGAFGGPGASLSYANGPNAGQLIADPSALNDNGLLAVALINDLRIKSLSNAINDLRVTRSWKLGSGNLTATAGYYKSLQTLAYLQAENAVITDIRGDADAALLNINTASGTAITQGGVFNYGTGSANGAYHRYTDVKYDINAPYASLNYRLGKLAIGGSLRYDAGTVQGSLFGGELGGGRIGQIAYDINGNGVISLPESKVSALPLASPAAVDYSYHYLSYSVSANYRIAEALAVSARHSKGGRAAADRILFTPAVDNATGRLTDPSAGYDTVKQTELGLKYREAGVTINLTGFSATTGERNLQINSRPDGTQQVVQIVREYSAKGVEFEGGVRRGIFSLTAGATYTDAEIKSDLTNPASVGNVPRHQASFIFEATPKIETQYATVGINVIGTTSSYAQDTNQLKLPAYNLVNLFAEVRPIERVQLTLNVNNLFDTLALAEITQATIPASRVVVGRAMLGRTVSTSLRYAF